MKHFLEALHKEAVILGKEENLPMFEIVFRSPVLGSKNRLGTCINKRSLGIYKLLIYTTKANFIECDDGKYLDKKTKKRFRKGLGKDRDKADIIKTVAHEMAHTKHWNHNINHKSYTNILNNILTERMGDLSAYD